MFTDVSQGLWVWGTSLDTDELLFKRRMISVELSKGSERFDRGLVVGSLVAFVSKVRVWGMYSHQQTPVAVIPSPQYPC